MKKPAHVLYSFGFIYNILVAVLGLAALIANLVLLGNATAIAEIAASYGRTEEIVKQLLLIGAITFAIEFTLSIGGIVVAVIQRGKLMKGETSVVPAMTFIVAGLLTANLFYVIGGFLGLVQHTGDDRIRNKRPAHLLYRIGFVINAIVALVLAVLVIYYTVVLNTPTIAQRMATALGYTVDAMTRTMTTNVIGVAILMVVQIAGLFLSILQKRKVVTGEGTSPTNVYIIAGLFLLNPFYFLGALVAAIQGTDEREETEEEEE
ncbi:MAG: hypothetical protein K6F32_03775 [Bacilli bacterium]|nr:hypothetical protein [Bacilli bacterium]